MTDSITAREFRETDGTGDWRVVGDGACTFVATDSVATSARLVQAISEIPGVEEHRPDIDIRPDGVTVRLLTAGEDWYGMSRRDVDLAARISGSVRDLGLTADPSDVQSVLVIVETKVAAEVMPFWRAVLGYEYRPDSPGEDLVDPRLRGPALWFEEVHEWRGKHNGIHLAVWVPHEVAEARVAAALAAGGRMVRDEAPSSWTLADALGNECDVATVLQRD